VFIILCHISIPILPPKRAEAKACSENGPERYSSSEEQAFAGAVFLALESSFSSVYHRIRDLIPYPVYLQKILPVEKLLGTSSGPASSIFCWRFECHV
jgi:hypothetical protein